MDKLFEVQALTTLRPLKSLLQHTFIMSICFLMMSCYTIKHIFTYQNGAEAAVGIIIAIAAAIWGFIVFLLHTGTGPKDIAFLEAQWADLGTRVETKDTEIKKNRHDYFSLLDRFNQLEKENERLRQELRKAFEKNQPPATRSL